MTLLLCCSVCSSRTGGGAHPRRLSRPTCCALPAGPAARTPHDSAYPAWLQGLNVELYWQNKDLRRFVNIVPTSAVTGEGICDLLGLFVKLTQTMMIDRLMFVEELQCTVLEVKVVEGYGHTIDAVLINGRLREGDKVRSSPHSPTLTGCQTRARSLPQPPPHTSRPCFPAARLRHARSEHGDARSRRRQCTATACRLSSAGCKGPS